MEDGGGANRVSEHPRKQRPQKADMKLARFVFVAENEPHGF